MNRRSLHLYATVFVTSLGMSTYIYFVPIFAQTFAATFLDLGYIGSANALAYAITPLMVGYLADRFNRARLFTLGIVINVFAAIVLILSRSVGDIVLFRLLGGFGYGFFWPTAEALVTDLAPIDKRVREMGLYSVAWASGFLVGPLVGGFIVQGFGFIWLFAISAALIALAIVPDVLWIVPGYQQSRRISQNFSGSFSTILKLRSWYLMVICYGIVFSIMSAIFPGYANSVGVSPEKIGLLFTVFGVSRIAVFATSERFSEFGEKRALITAAGIISVGGLAITANPDFTGFLVSLIFMGGCFGVIFPLAINLISRHFPNERVGFAVGSYETAFGVGFAVGPLLAGTVAAIANPSLTFLVISFCGVMMSVFVASGRTYQNSK